MATGALVEEVATNLEEVAEATRKIDTRALGFFFTGIGVGAALGFFYGYRWNREKIRAEIIKDNEEEIQEIREYYKSKIVAAEQKPSVAEVIEERGYSTAVEDERASIRPLRAPVPVREPVSAPPAPPQVIYEGGKDKNQGWDYPAEVAARTQEHPYVIHQDEFKQGESGYSQTTYTYWAGDDVLTDTDNHPLPHGDIVVGQENLKWGHGTDDIDVVFVRNDMLELEMEICRVYQSYSEEVLGHEMPEPPDPELDLEHSDQPRPAPKRKRH
jgi:hypothetical protein